MQEGVLQIERIKLTMQLKKAFYNYASHYKALLKLGLPIVIGQLGVIVLGFADTLMIGHHGTYELAAASFVNSMFGLIIVFSVGFSCGLIPIVGSLYGKRQYKEAGQVLKSSFVANALVGLLLTLIMLILYLNIDKLGQPEELLPLIRPYFLVLLFSLLFVLLFNCFKQFADAITDTRTPMWVLLGGNLINIIGNYLLIYGKLGLPELGLLGAGVSTLCSRILMLLVFAWIVFRQRRFARYRVGVFRTSWSIAHFRRLNTLGWPIALQMGMESASFGLSAVMIGWIGTMALAAHQIMCTVSLLTFMIYYGMGSAIAVRVSNFKGQNDTVNERRSANAGFHLIMLMAVILCTIIFMLRNYIAGWFTSGDEVHYLVGLLILPFLLYQFGDALQIAFANALRGIADVKPMMWIAFIAYFLISIPLSYVFGFVLDWKIVGVWMGFPIGLTIACVLFWLRFRKKTRLSV